jgi:hypothetical protein
MVSEMDAMNMDERQRHSWLLANRVTLMLVGVTWLGMIAWELANKRTPLFLIAMVPTFAMVRFVVYRHFQRVPPRHDR